MGETKIIYHIDDEDTPYLIKLPVSADKVTLGDFKNALNRPNYKFFFKSMDDDFGVVKEEIIDEDTHLPCFNGRVVSWLVPAESSASDSQSQSGEVPTASERGERVGGIGDSRPPSFHNTTSDGSRDDTCDTCTDESESVLGTAKKPVGPSRLNGQWKQQGSQRSERGLGDSSTLMSSDVDTASFMDSEDDTASRFSLVTDTATSLASRHGRHRRRSRHRRPSDASRSGMTKASSFTSITDSTMSLNIINVTLNMDSVTFLGISIVGQNNKGGDGGIYIGSIMKGGAVAQDGRVEPGDMILEVNGVSFEDMSNDDAVKTLREAVQKGGAISLVVAKCWDPNPKGYFTVPRQEPVRPIDPSAWVAHTAALREHFMGGRGGVAGGPSLTIVPSTTSSVSTSIPEAERSEDLNLTINTDMATVVKAMAHSDSGLEIRDRMWLKITIPNAFIGADMVDWLFSHVEGFTDRRDARKYACNLLRCGYIRHTVNKLTFSEQCYYIFGDYLGGPPVYPDLSAVSLDDVDSVSDADRDTLVPLPTPSSGPAPLPPNPYASVVIDGSGGSSIYAAGSFVKDVTPTPNSGGAPPPLPPPLCSPPGGGGGGGGGNDSASSVYSASVHNACSCVPLSVKWPACLTAERMLVKTVCTEKSEPNNNSSSAKVTGPRSSKETTTTPATTTTSAMPGNEGTSQPSTSQKKTAAAPPHHEKPEYATPTPTSASTPTPTPTPTQGSANDPDLTPVPGPRCPTVKPPMMPAVPATTSSSSATVALESLPPELLGSRQSFRMAMGNPCEFFVDFM
ncbi:segment polarity protein dishevelled homolog DVL-3-like [Babylonia areolata]|uniref:segment polarity protein dishevelled homolog DVL-3-like n=1 Tax=Babylonia areolata TaxID=304850 RepID=UPI003FD033BA